VAALPLVRVRLKHPDVKTFVERFAANVTRGGVFLASREPRPVGALVRFEVCLVTGQIMLSGEGRVTWVKPFNAGEPTRPHGMGVQFTQLEGDSRPMLDRLLERREATGRRPSPPPPPPRPAYAERRSSEPISNEFDGVEDTALRRALDRARVLADNPWDEGVEKELDQLLAAEPDAPVTLEQALGELPRFLARGRGSGLFRLPAEPGPTSAGQTSAGPTPVPPPEPTTDSAREVTEPTEPTEPIEPKPESSEG
jgi:uncharacterized protein (TIGR02266 family)